MYSSWKELQRVLSANEIRKTFIDYFVHNHNHNHVRSSPVVPFCDPTVAFVNSGMNQFKSVFLGKCPPPYPRVANSQKCVRVGGKHNDLDAVGKDGYHHTFFEMLGNWSFGDYFKLQACEMALNLLQGPYQISSERLYVTYFGGDTKLGLPADMECYEIWRSLGFPAHKIVPFGATDNFWEMDATGPCGPCTEIHYDHRPDLGTSHERAKLINTGRSDLIELWNLVFIQYKRNPDSTLTPLLAQHVDTGMGFERLTALLQNKVSNYDTDIFTPFFETIQKISRAPPYHGNFPDKKNDAILDTGYRILADHVRMISICLADGMLPDQNQKLRRVLRRTFKIGEQIFNNESLTLQLIPVAIETLGTAYPELYKRQASIFDLVSFEQEVYKSVREKSTKAFAEELVKFPNLQNTELMDNPGFVPAYRDFQSQKKNFTDRIIPGKFLFKLFDTYGLTEESFQVLAELEGMKCDLKDFNEELSRAKSKSKTSFHKDSRFNEVLAQLTQKLADTDNSFKYKYSYNAKERSYEMETLKACIQGILINNEEIRNFKYTSNDSCTADDMTIAIIMDKSNFYYESGGQQSDIGEIILPSKKKLKVINVNFVNNCVVHICKIPDDSFLKNYDFEININDEVLLALDIERRQGNMRHHTATHLINGALRTLFEKVTYQVSSAVNENQCKLEFGIIGKRISQEEIAAINNLIGSVIAAAIPVEIETIDASDVMLRDDITMVPGEVYPETGLRLINIISERPLLSSKELCCGTHTTNTQELLSFCITNLKLTNRARYAITAVAGTHAENAFKSATILEQQINKLDHHLSSPDVKDAESIESELKKIRNHILHTSDLIIPYVMRHNFIERITELLKRIKNSARTSLNEFVEIEMKNVLIEKPKDKYPYLVHYIRSSALVEEVFLQKATKLCEDRPLLVVGMCNGVLKARCCVPKNCITQNFTADKWLQIFAEALGAQIAKREGENFARVCSLKGKKVSALFEEQLEDGIAKSNQFAVQNFVRNKNN